MTRKEIRRFLPIAKSMGIHAEILMNEHPAFDRPLCIIGCPRSGTSFLARSIGQHVAQTKMYNEHDSAYYVGKYWGNNSIYSSELTDEDVGFFRRLAVRSWEFHRPSNPAREEPMVLALKNNRILFFHRHWAAAFPNAKYIYIYRDGRDVAKSMLRHPSIGPSLQRNISKDQLIKGIPHLGIWTEEDANRHMQQTAYERAVSKWVAKLKMASELKSIVPSENWLEIRYEDLESQQVEITQEVVNFAGFHPYSNIFFDFNASSIENHKKVTTEEEFAMFEKWGGETNRRNGYE